MMLKLWFTQHFDVPTKTPRKHLRKIELVMRVPCRISQSLWKMATQQCCIRHTQINKTNIVRCANGARLSYNFKNTLSDNLSIHWPWHHGSQCEAAFGQFPIVSNIHIQCIQTNGSQETSNSTPHTATLNIDTHPQGIAFPKWNLGIVANLPAD